MQNLQLSGNGDGQDGHSTGDEQAAVAAGPAGGSTLVEKIAAVDHLVTDHFFFKIDTEMDEGQQVVKVHAGVHNNGPKYTGPQPPAAHDA